MIKRLNALIGGSGRLSSAAQPINGSAAVAETRSGRPILVSQPTFKVREQSLGKAHYSYGFAAASFVAMFDQYDMPTLIVDYPEQFKSKTFARINDLDEGLHVHLIFRSTEQIRPINGAFNVACFAWEFDALKADGLATESSLDNQVDMLKACQEVWTPCRYTKQVLANYGIDRVHVIPAPIRIPAEATGDRHARLHDLMLQESVPLISKSTVDEAEFIRIAEQYSAPLGSHPSIRRAVEDGLIFLTVCNPYDKRKNLVSLIEGFLMAVQGREDCVLIVKLVTSGMFDNPAGYLFHQMRVLFGNPHCLHERQVILFSSFLADEEMDALYDSADYYLCTSLGEGQNLPMLEAMAHGCVPVSVANTAMADYIDDRNSVVIAERRFKGLVSGIAADVAASRLVVPFADRFQVAAAVEKALGLSTDERAEKSMAARNTVVRLFSPEKVLDRVSSRLRAVLPVAEYS